MLWGRLCMSGDGGLWEISVSSHLCCEPKKQKSYKEKERRKEDMMEGGKERRNVKKKEKKRKMSLPLALLYSVIYIFSST